MLCIGIAECVCLYLNLFAHLFFVPSLDAGAQTFPNATFGWVNVKDVATAHILAFEVPSASGRYCLVERVAHYSEVVKALSELYPTFQLPEKYIFLSTLN